MVQSEIKNDEIVRKIEEEITKYDETFRKYFGYRLYTENGNLVIHMSKLLDPQPNSDFSYSACKLLVEQNKDSIPMSVRKIDTSPEDQPSGSEYTYFLNASVCIRNPEEDIEKVIRTIDTIKKIEDKYRTGLYEVRKRLIKGDLPIKEAFSIILG